MHLCWGVRQALVQSSEITSSSNGISRLTALSSMARAFLRCSKDFLPYQQAKTQLTDKQE